MAVGDSTEQPPWSAGELTVRRRRLALCQVLIDQRRLIGVHFGFSLCADPAWDMLLDLYLSESRNRPISLSSLCTASNVPATTALRCIKLMVSRALVVRKPDRLDARRIHVELTPNARESLERVLDAVADLPAVALDQD